MKMNPISLMPKIMTMETIFMQSKLQWTRKPFSMYRTGILYIYNPPALLIISSHESGELEISITLSESLMDAE